MAYETILFEVQERVATVTLHRPDRLNAWNAQMARELSDALRRADADDEVRAVIVTGQGRAFCAGADLEAGGETFGARRARAVDADGDRRDAPTYPWQIHKPVVAAINGHAIGVGITYPMTCDIRFVAEDAKVQFAFVRRGIIPELASHAIVARVAGLSRAADLLLTGRMIRGRQLAEMGLASAALPADKVLEAARVCAREFLQAAPVSVAIAKRLLWDGLTTSIADMARRENPLFAWAGRQADAREGVTAFLEKRDPEWKMKVSTDLPRDLLGQDGGEP